MADLFGTIVNVATANVGEFLTADVAVGAASLPITAASTFDEKGGEVILNGIVYRYWSVDLANNLLLLDTTSGLLLTLSSVGAVTSAALADDRVEIWPPRPEKKALIDFGVDEGEAVFAIVPQNLNAVVQDGFRDEGARETVLVEDRNVGELYVKDVIATPPDLLPVEIALGDGVPPIASPTPVVTGWVGALHAKWAAIEGPDFISYEVHLSAISGFSPTESTLVGTTSATSMTIRSLPNDLLLAYNTTYYVKIVAFDVDGTATPGDQGSAQLQPITGPDISAAYVYAGEVNAAQIHGGEISADLILSGSIATALSGGRTYMDSSGIVIYDPTGTPGTTLAPDQSVFVGDAEIGGLTVKDAMSVRGVSNELSTSAELLLAAGITAPSTGPSIVQDWETITFTKDGDASFNASNLTSVQWLIDKWICGYKKAGTDEYYVLRFNSDGTYHSDATSMVISPTALQTTQVGAGGTCYTIASNNTILKHAGTPTYDFQDDFASSINTTDWPTRSNVAWNAGAARITGSGHLATDYDWDANNHRFSAKVTRSGSTSQDLFMTLHDDATNSEFAEIKLTGSTLRFRIYESQNGVIDTSTSITYNPTTHAYWRILEIPSGAGGDLHFYTSADGVTWTERYTGDHDWANADMDAVRLWFEVQGSGMTADIDEVRIGPNAASSSHSYSTLNDDGDVMTIGNDGTNLLLAEHDNTGANDRLHVRVIDAVTMLTSSTFFSDQQPVGTDYNGPLAGILKGSFDLGADRYIWKRVGTTATSAEWYSINTSNGDDMLAERFPADGGGSKSITWDGSNFWALGNDGKIYKHTSVKHTSGGALLAFAAGFTWFDSNATGGTHETPISPVSTFTLKKRARLTVTAPGIPGAGGTDDPNSIRVYLGLTAGTLKLEATTGAGANSAILNSLSGAGAAPPGANNFPGGIPAKIKSTTGGLIISGDGTISGGVWLPTEIGNAVNLDSLTTAGTYSQTSDAEAAAGSNYPVPYAGFLEVIAAGSIKMQRYTAHRNADLTTAPSVWERFHNGTSWTAWVPLFDDHGTETVVANFCVASTNFSISSGTVRLFGKHLSLRINWTRTTSTLGVPGDGNITNTPICQMTAKYRPGTGTDQGGLATGATGRGAAFIIGSDGTITMTWVDGGDTAGGLDIVATDTGSVLGTVLMG